MFVYSLRSRGGGGKMRSAMKCSVVILAILAIVLPAAVMAQDTIKIGVLYPLTGGAAAEGRELRAGAELAQDIANNAYPAISMNMAKNAGVKSLGGKKIELIFKDHEGNP